MNSTTNPTEKLPSATVPLYQAFSQVPDPRCKRGVRYPLAAILTVVVLAKLCGETELRGIAQWAQYRADQLCAAFGLQRVCRPHSTTYSRILSQVDAQAVQAAIAPALAPGDDSGGEQVLIDGKALRGTIPTGSSVGAHLVSVYAPARRQVLAQARVGSQANELGVAPAVLAHTTLAGKLVSGDAMFTHRHLSQQILDAGGDYLWSVKPNQPRLYAMIVRLFTPERPRPGHGPLATDFQTVSQVNQGHGRTERRVLTTSSLLRGYADWPGIEQVFRLERHRQVKGAAATREVVYGITSLAATSTTPRDLLHCVRRHWAIENQLHYVRDVSLREDACRLASASAQVLMALLNNLVIALLPFTPFAYLPDAQRYFNAHLAQALHLLL